MAKRRKMSLSLKIALLYALLGAMWIFLSDKVLSLFVDTPDLITHIAIIKGWLYVSVTASLLYMLIKRSIDQLERSQEALRESRDQLDLKVREKTADLVKTNMALREKAALLDLAHDAILVRGLDDTISYWNRGAERMYGWKKEEAEGKPVHTLLQTQFPILLEKVKSAVIHEGEWQGELLHITREGARIVVESRWALQRDETGAPVAFLEINRDVTARKEAEASLQGYAQRLEESNRMLQDFAFIASHDLQEPLRKIQTFGERLRARHSESLGKEGLDYLERMRGAVGRMQGLLQSLLTYSRVTTQAEPFVPVDLGDIIQEAIADLEVSVQESRGTVDVGPLPKIEADPNQMRQLFQNLIGNALKFHGKAGPVVKVHGKPCGKGLCEITVEDDGIGFDEKHLEKIFAPFQRLHGRSSPYKGSGMGLAICRKIVERHNGSITARSEPGKGSVFMVSLPLEQSR